MNWLLFLVGAIVGYALMDCYIKRKRNGVARKEKDNGIT